MVWFYRDFLDGFIYLIVAVLSVIFIMAIIGFIMERLKLEKEAKNRIAVLQNEELTTASETATPSFTEQKSDNTAESVIPEEVLQKSENAATNDAIPEVLDLNKVEENSN